MSATATRSLSYSDAEDLYSLSAPIRPNPIAWATGIAAHHRQHRLAVRRSYSQHDLWRVPGHLDRALPGAGAVWVFQLHTGVCRAVWPAIRARAGWDHRS